MHSFHAYIDESGDDGFKFADAPMVGSSQWFIITACLVKASKMSEASAQLASILAPHEKDSPVHFAKLKHDQRVAIAHSLGKLPVRLIAICVNKRALSKDHTLAGDRRLYFYCTRYLLERVSWLARDHKASAEGNGACRLHFSACKGLSYSNLRDYLDGLKTQSTSIHWQSLDVSKFDIKPHKEMQWLRAADIAASSLRYALETSKYGFCEDRYARLLRPVIYARKKKVKGYGLKIFPEIPLPEKEKDNRYEWLSLLD